MKNRIFYFGGIERLNLTSSEVLGISDYWRQTVKRHGDRNRPAADRRSGQGRRRLQRSEPRLLPLHRRLQALSERRRHVARRVGAARDARDAADLRRSAVERGRQLDVDAEQSRVQRAAASATASTSRGFSRTSPADWADPICWRPPATTRRPATRPGSSRASTFPGRELRRDLVHRRSKARATYSSSTTSHSVRGRHQLKTGRRRSRASRCTWTSRPHNVGIWGFTQDKQFDPNDPSSFPSSFSGNIGSGLANPAIWNPSVYLQDTWQARDDLTFNLGARYDLDLTPTSVNPLCRSVQRAHRRAPRRHGAARAVEGRPQQPLAARRRRLGTDGRSADDAAQQPRDTTTRTTGTSPTST